MSFWLSSRGFELQIKVRARLDVVRAAFADPTRWLRHHPLITDVVEQPEGSGIYQVTERVPFAGLPIPNRYRVRSAPHEHGVESEAWSAPSIHITSSLTWAEDGEATRIREVTQIKVPFPVASFVARTAEKAHVEQLERIRTLLEEEADGRRARA